MHRPTKAGARAGGGGHWGALQEPTRGKERREPCCHSEATHAINNVPTHTQTQTGFLELIKHLKLNSADNGALQLQMPHQIRKWGSLCVGTHEDGWGCVTASLATKCQKPRPQPGLLIPVLESGTTILNSH
jgi:hypothetical protein